MIRQNELMNVRCSERGSLLGIKIYSPSSECLIECVDISEQYQTTKVNTDVADKMAESYLRGHAGFLLKVQSHAEL